MREKERERERERERGQTGEGPGSTDDARQLCAMFGLCDAAVTSAYEISALTAK